MQNRLNKRLKVLIEALFTFYMSPLTVLRVAPFNLTCLLRHGESARSPVFTHMSSTLNGLATLRVHQSQVNFQQTFDDLQDVHSSAWYLFLSSARWFGQWLDWICVTYVTCVTYVCVILRDSKYELLVSIFQNGCTTLSFLFIFYKLK